jgi:hypothetical protein
VSQSPFAPPARAVPFELEGRSDDEDGWPRRRPGGELRFHSLAETDEVTFRALLTFPCGETYIMGLTREGVVYGQQVGGGKLFPPVTTEEYVAHSRMMVPSDTGGTLWRPKAEELVEKIIEAVREMAGAAGKV